VFVNELLNQPQFDGKWVAPVMDNLSTILCKLAVMADVQASEQGVDKNETLQVDSYKFDEEEEHSENKHVEECQRVLQRVDQQLKSEKVGLDSRKYF